MRKTNILGLSLDRSAGKASFLTLGQSSILLPFFAGQHDEDFTPVCEFLAN